MKTCKDLNIPLCPICDDEFVFQACCIITWPEYYTDHTYEMLVDEMLRLNKRDPLSTVYFYAAIKLYKPEFAGKLSKLLILC
jgi:hypothetical protein